jgi:CarD family transcriptional regulator
MYNVGTYVSYRSEGICVVVEIKRQRFGALNEFKDFYVLSPIIDPNSKIFIPTDNERLVAKMRPLCSADEVNALAERLKDERVEWIETSRPRTNAFREIISEGNREVLIKLIHTVIEHQKMHVTQGDLTTLIRAKKMLIDEFSFTTDIKTEADLMAVLNGEKKCQSK